MLRDWQHSSALHVKHTRRHLVAGGCCTSAAAAAACDAAPTGFRASKKLSGKLYRLPRSAGIAKLSKAVVGVNAHSYMLMIHSCNRNATQW